MSAWKNIRERVRRESEDESGDITREDPYRKIDDKESRQLTARADEMMKGQRARAAQPSAVEQAQRKNSPVSDAEARRLTARADEMIGGAKKRVKDRKDSLVRDDPYSDTRQEEADNKSRLDDAIGARVAEDNPPPVATPPATPPTPEQQRGQVVNQYANRLFGVGSAPKGYARLRGGQEGGMFYGNAAEPQAAPGTADFERGSGKVRDLYSRQIMGENTNKGFQTPGRREIATSDVGAKDAYLAGRNSAFAEIEKSSRGSSARALERNVEDGDRAAEVVQSSREGGKAMESAGSSKEALERAKGTVRRAYVRSEPSRLGAPVTYESKEGPNQLITTKSPPQTASRKDTASVARSAKKESDAEDARVAAAADRLAPSPLRKVLPSGEVIEGGRTVASSDEKTKEMQDEADQYFGRGSSDLGKGEGPSAKTERPGVSSDMGGPKSEISADRKDAVTKSAASGSDSGGYDVESIQDQLPAKTGGVRVATASDEDAKGGSRAADPMASANRSMKPKVYTYKEGFAELEGQSPNEVNVGPIAQAMKKDPVASTVIVEDKKGMLGIDKSKGLKLVMGSVADLQDQIDELKGRKVRRGKYA